MFIALLTGIVSASNHTKSVTLSNQKCMTQPTLINLHPNLHPTARNVNTIRLN